MKLHHYQRRLLGLKQQVPFLEAMEVMAVLMSKEDCRPEIYMEIFVILLIQAAPTRELTIVILVVALLRFKLES